MIVELTEVPSNNKLPLPRMANVVESVVWIGGDPRQTMTVNSEIETWSVNLKYAAPKSERKFLQLKLDATPTLFTGKIVAEAGDDGVITLPAKFARTYGSKLRFEPQPHKNTVGYWTVEKDYAEWHFKVKSDTTYDVEILQGCGKGHGGSGAEIQVGDQKLAFTVQDTGHFQNFRRRQLGQIKLKANDDVTLKLVATKKAAGAVMDCREIRLVPNRK